MDRVLLTDEMWAQIEPLCCGRLGDAGQTGRDTRLFLEAVLLIARTRPAEPIWPLEQCLQTISALGKDGVLAIYSMSYPPHIRILNMSWPIVLSLKCTAIDKAQMGDLFSGYRQIPRRRNNKDTGPC